MSVETASYISQLNANYPAATDLLSEGDNHIRLTKSVLQTQFPNFGTVAVTATATQLNYSVGVTSAIQTQFNTITAALTAFTGGATPWVSGTTYALYALVVSPLDTRTYRKITASSVSTIDPSLDSTNWTLSGGTVPDFLLMAQGVK